MEQKATFTPEKSTEIYAIDTSPLFDNVFCSAGGNQHINIWKIPDTFDDNTKVNYCLFRQQKDQRKVKPTTPIMYCH